MSNQGLISSHANDVKHMRPEIARVDALQFDVDIASDGTFTAPVKQSVPANYLSSLAEIRGYMQKPSEDPELSGTVYFNIRDQSRQGEMFSSKIMMGHLVDTAGGGQPMKFEHGLYVFAPGTDIQVSFSIDGDGTVGYAALASAAKRWSILLTFNQFSE